MAGTTKVVTTNAGVKSTAATVFPKFVTTPTAATGFPASNMLLKDRAVRWACPAAGGNIDWTIDLGAATTVNIVGMLGVQAPTGFASEWGVTGRLGPTVACTADSTITITRATGSFVTDGVTVGMTVSGTYIAAGTTVVARTTSSVTLSQAATGTGATTVSFGPLLTLAPLQPFSNARGNEAYELAAAVIVRYVTFTVNSVFTSWAVGKLLVGRTTDLGIAYSPGSTEAIVKRGVDNVTVEGARTFTRTGADGLKFSMQFQAVPDSVKTTLFATVSADRVLALIHPVHGIVEAFVSDDEFEATHRWGSPDLWDLTLNLETLP